MPSFSVAPGAFPPAVPEDFPDFLRWQDEGTYLDSSRTIDTVNLVGAGIQDVSVDSGGTVLTITLGSPVALKSPGWMTDVVDPDSLPLHVNSGYGRYDDYIDPPGVPIYGGDMYAGVENYSGETIVWSLDWIPVDTDPPPILTPLSGGRVKVDWVSVDAPPDGSEGLLVLSITVNGIASPETIWATAGPGWYNDMAWGPTP